MASLAEAFQDAAYGSGNTADREGKIYRRASNPVKVRTTRTAEARKAR